MKVPGPGHVRAAGDEPGEGISAGAPEPTPLSGRVAVVTGGARGIGSATGRALLAAGASVVIADLDLFEAMLCIHAVVPFRMIRECLRLWRPLAKREAAAGHPRRRKIVNVSSRAATRGLAGGANYAAGKAAMLGLTYSAAKECARLAINVNAAALGPVSTRFRLPREAGT
ncbi:MAG: SDR family NAD(P)-dependent oxidoreductase [Streptosporangiaceae bacterium]